jgi:hypothetical protein
MKIIKSEVLKEDVIFLENNEIKSNVVNPRGLIIYEYRELQCLNKLSLEPEDLRFVHRIKKEFDGIIEGGGEHGYQSARGNGQDNKVRQGIDIKERCGAEPIRDTAMLIQSHKDVFEFFKDYREFRKRIIGN